jgi:hypothetical protein
LFLVSCPNSWCTCRTVKALKKTIPKMLAKLIVDLPGWSIDLKLGGPSPDGEEILYRQ